MGLCEECEAFDIQKLGRGPCGYRYEETLQRAQGCDFCRTLAEHGEVRELARRRRLPEEAWFHFEVFSESNNGEGGGVGETGIRANRLRVTLAPRYFVQLSQFESREFLTIDFYLQADPGTSAAENNDILGCVEVLGPDRVRLCVTDNKKGAYITLSHRWEGDTKGCSTTTENYDARLVDIPISTLTKTFQGAILVAHLTGIPYLWIDSICIIQTGDAKEDWKRESVKMAQYYQNSIFTLTTIRGPGQVGVLPSKSQLGDRSLIQLPYRDQRGNRKGYVYLYLIDYNLRTSYRNLIQGDELLGRGWVFQEQMFSRRLFSTSCNGRLTPGTNLFEEYSGKELTYWSDRVPALSGITSEYRRFMQLWDIPPYLSGVWTGDVYFGLMWAQQGEPKPIARIEGIASWSWASLPAEVSWSHLYAHRKKLVPACRIISVAEINRAKVEEWKLSSKKDKIPTTANSGPEFPLNRVINQLKIQGKLQRVIIREQRPSEDDSSFIFWGRCHSFGHDSLRRFAYSPSRPDLVAGWASFEHPGYGSIADTSEENGLNFGLCFSDHDGEGS
ncbi:HET-domain-containing protein [Stipitochalara longipes BDJ]|nr:HET-domain-containing protein [Stipitochalara longipes BDJ]